jgi:hypothetical protein
MAARMRCTLAEAVTNNDAKIDAWIKAGFDSMTRKINKREREELGSTETFALVKGKNLDSDLWATPIQRKISKHINKLLSREGAARSLDGAEARHDHRDHGQPRPRTRSS